MSAENTNVMTQDARDRLRWEVGRLETEGRREIAERLSVAREWGDLKENTEYSDAKESGSMLESRITMMRNQLACAEIVEEKASGKTVGMGSTVTYGDSKSGKDIAFKLVSSLDAAPAEGRLSMDSPVARALAGHKVGDTVSVTTPSGKRTMTIKSLNQ